MRSRGNSSRRRQIARQPVNKNVIRGLMFVVLGCLLLVQSPVTAQQVSPDDGLRLAIQKSLQQTSSQLHVLDTDSRLSVAAARTVQIADLGFIAYAVKILDQQTDTIYIYWYDENAEPTTEEAAFQARAAAYEAHYGHLSRSLYERIQGVGLEAQASIPIAIWAEQPVGTDVPATPPGPHRVYLPFIMGGAGTPVERIVRFLNERGYSVDYISSEAPVVYATIPASVIGELQAQSYVAAIYEQAETSLTMESAARTSAAPWTWSRGITGSGIKVAVLEDDGVAFDNPYIDGSSYYIGWWPRVGSHATQVAGVVASDHATQRGIAYDAEILSANALLGTESGIIAASDWAIREGADVINASIGWSCQGTDIASIDKYFDWVVWSERRTAVVSAGNVRSQCSSNYNVTSPGKAYNVITVGAKDDVNTATTENDTQDDVFSYFSCYVDPNTASENRLKPEVVAVGQRIRTTSTASPWIESGEVAGTSFSAPIVAGEAALMMQRASWLERAPEAVKAGIMASARWTYLHDDENWSNWTSIEKMGGGAIDTTAADNSLINNRIQELYLQKSSFTDNAYDIYFDGIAEQRIRVVITWSSHPSRVWITNWILHDRLEGDFDLTVRAPNGQIFGSYADEANYEIVEFVASQTGSYRARIHLSRWDNSSMEERVGFAWYSGFPLP
jgi:hypothetical protein